MDQEILGELLTAIVAIITLICIFAALIVRPNDPTIHDIALMGIPAIVVFYFQLRTATKTQNGQLKALSKIADQVSAARSNAAETANVAGRQTTEMLHSTTELIQAAKMPNPPDVGAV